MKKYAIKPSRSMSRVSFFIGLLFSFFGIMMIIFALSTPLPTILLLPFGIAWTAIAIYNTYRAYQNGFTEEGDAIYEINYSEGNIGQGYDFEEKLRKIERLRREGLITEDEYNQKRSEVMKEKW